MIFPIDTILGELEMIKEYEYYDCPRLFTCKDETGKIYIGLSVKDGDGWQMWLYVHVTNDRLKKIENGDFDIRDAFVDAEECSVFGVTTYNEQPDTANWILSKLIPEEYLPYKGQTLIPAEKKNE